MPRGYNNYSYVIDSSFQPFTMQEMLVPFTAYKEAAERDEAAYVELQDKADKFKYLSETLPEGSKARDIYESYANQLQADAQDFVNNGVSMNNRRSLTNLKRNYSGTIGRLAEADIALKKEQELRRQLSAKDPSMLYAIDSSDLNIDKFLDNQTPNLYSVSGTDLYTKGAAAGQAASKRIYSAGDEGSTLGGYYRDYVQKMGYTPEQLARFGAQIANDFASTVQDLPELQQAANQILEANGVNANLSGETLRQAQQQVIRGIIDGSVYTESHNPTRDLGKMTATEAAADARAKATQNMQQEEFNMRKQDWEDRRRLTYTFDEQGNVTGFNPEYIGGNYEVDPNTGKLKKKSTSTQSSEEKKEIQKENKKQAALLKLEKKDLAHNSGFDVTFGDDRHHYEYIGALANSRGKWRQGAIGDDVPGHGWGLFSSSNVESKWGNFSAEGSDSEEMRVLSADQINRVLQSDPGLLEAFNTRVDAYLKERGIDPNSEEAQSLDIQIIEVPNEKDSKKVGYLIAIH